MKIFGTSVSNFAPAGSPALTTDPAGQDDAIQEPVLQPGKSMVWENCNCDGARALALDLPIAANAPIEITAKETTVKTTASVPVQAYAGKDLMWPGLDSDLRLNEGWNVTSNHIGWGQTFALDTQIAGWNGSKFSTLWPEAVDADKLKQDHRAYGMPVYAAVDGIVCHVLRDHTEKAGVNSTEFTWSPSLGKKDSGGNAVKIRFGDFYLLYAHMQRWSVPENLALGTLVRKGQYLGKVGNSGSTGGPHLHIHMAKVDPSAPADSCDGGTIRPMGFDQVQTITRAEANPLGVEGTLAADHWTHVDNVAPPHAGSVMNPTTDDFNFCADCTDDKTYLAVWNPSTEIDLRVKIAGWSAFTAHHARLSADGFRLRRIETFVENGERQYVGVFKRGSGAYGLWQGEGWSNFLSVWNDQFSKGAHLVDIESFDIAGRRFYLGVFASGSGVPALIRSNNWSDFVAQRNALATDGKRLIDVETFIEGSNRVHLGVFEQGTGGHALRRLNGYSAFAADWAAQHALGLRLVSVESFVSGSDRWYIGTYRSGTGTQHLAQNTSWGNHWRLAEDLNYRDNRIADLHVLQ